VWLAKYLKNGRNPTDFCTAGLGSALARDFPRVTPAL
jgi:hypothetical protein